MRIVITILISVVLLGCGVTPQRVNPDDPLSSGYGLVMMSVYCDTPVVWVMVNKPGDKASWGRAIQKVSCGEAWYVGNRNVVKLFPMPQGEYVIGSYLTDTGRMYSHTLYKIQVEADVINYIGRVEIKSNVVVGNVDGSKNSERVDVFYRQEVSLVDNESKDKREILEYYPDIFKDHEYLKKLAEKM